MAEIFMDLRLQRPTDLGANIRCYAVIGTLINPPPAGIRIGGASVDRST
jgi:hypothetical protein